MTEAEQPPAWRSEGEYRGGGQRGTALIFQPGTALISGVTSGWRPVVYSVVDGLAIVEGDIILGTVEELQHALDEFRRRGTVEVDAGDPKRGVGIRGARWRWPYARVPFNIDPGLPTLQRVQDAIIHWETNTPIRFLERTDANASQFPNFVSFVGGDGCSSYVGMIGGRQEVTLEAGCSTGNAIHEIGHTVGLLHEHDRSDRDLYLTIHWGNIATSPDNMVPEFLTYTTDFADNLGPYDYRSIMHYGRKAFSANGLDTITPIDQTAQIGQRDALSKGDIAAVGVMYSRELGAVYEREPSLVAGG